MNFRIIFVIIDVVLADIGIGCPFVDVWTEFAIVNVLVELIDSKIFVFDAKYQGCHCMLSVVCEVAYSFGVLALWLLMRHPGTMCYSTVMKPMANREVQGRQKKKRESELIVYLTGTDLGWDSDHVAKYAFLVVLDTGGHHQHDRSIEPTRFQLSRTLNDGTKNNDSLDRFYPETSSHTDGDSRMSIKAVPENV